MNRQHIYQAKSMGVAVLSILLFSAGTKTCQLPKSLKKKKTQSTVQYVPAPQQKDSAALVESTPAVPQRSLYKRLKDSTATMAPKAVKNKPHYEWVKEAPSASPAHVPHAQVVPTRNEVVDRVTVVPFRLDQPDSPDEAAEEVKQMSVALQSSTNNPAKKQVFFDTSKTETVSEKAPEGSGNSYFNATVTEGVKEQMNAVFTTRLMYDSVIASTNKDFVFNNLTVNNTTSSPLELQVLIANPVGWQLVTSNTANVTLDPYGSTIIPIRLLPAGNNTAEWQQIRIEYRLKNMIDIRKDVFKVKVQEYAGFKASLPNSTKVMTGYQKEVLIPVIVKNSGNTPNTYTIAGDNSFFKLDRTTSIQLAPGKDTTYMIKVSLTESQFSMLKKEDVKVVVTTSQGEAISLIQSVSKVGSIFKDHSSAYLDMPLQIEAGVMYQGSETPVQYYGGLYGNVDLDENNHLSMSLRSKTYAKGQRNDNSQVRFDYQGTHWQASVGNIQGIGEYVMDGYGARLAYNWNQRNKVEVFGLLKSRTGDSKVYGGVFQYRIKNKINVSDAITSNFDNVRNMNSGIFTQITELPLKNGRFSLITGAGAEQNKNTLKDGTKNKTLVGTSLGYNFLWSNERLSVVSNVLYNSNSYPGIFKGQRLMMHDARWMVKKLFLGGFYEYNFRKQTLFKDSILVTDLFNMKTTNFGAKVGWNASSASLVLAAGKQNQLQEGTDRFEVDYKYLNLNASAMLLKKIFVSLTTFGGINSLVGGSKKDDVFVSSTQGTVQYKAFGASGRYDHGPYYYNEYAAYTGKHEDYRRFIFSPFAEVNLFKKNLNVRFQGNYAKTAPGNISNSNVLMNLGYSNAKYGYDININGIVPVNGSAGSSYLSASFRMRLVAPFIPARKYYSLKLVMFKDVNGNGVRDGDDEPVAGQTLSLDGNLFVSDANGAIIFRNTEKGRYKADFGFNSKLKGWIPSMGTIQQYTLSSNRAIDVPYKISKVLQGKLNVMIDSNSSVQFNPANIKVTATGEGDEIYSTLTDDNGEFYFNLPAGNYIVTLSESAFGETFRPVQISQTADLKNNDTKTVYYEIKQKKRQINIKKK